MTRTFGNNPHVGLFVVATDEYVLAPEQIEEKDLKAIKEVLGENVVQTRIAGTSLLGVFAAGNSKGVVVPYIVAEEEVKALEAAGINVLVLHDVATALGNLIAVNDRGALVSPLISERNAERIGEFLDVEVMRVNVAGNELAGASVFVSNRGFIVHPNATEEEVEALTKLFGVEGRTGTANYGDPFVGTCMAGNTRGTLVGEDTSPAELMIIQDVLG